MNLIACSEPCRYQQEGFCTRENFSTFGAKINGCCYFEPMKPTKKFPAN